MPALEATHFKPTDIIPFNQAVSQNNPSGKWIHFFIDDYQFERVWNSPNKYLSVLKRFSGVITTDFSMYTDMPRAHQIYNCWRNRAMAYWMQSNGINIVPTICWSDAVSYDWCFEGLPKGGSVALSTNGCLSNIASEYYFICGYDEMIRRLEPESVLIYGRRPKNFHDNRAYFIESYSQIMKKRLK